LRGLDREASRKIAEKKESTALKSKVGTGHRSRKGEVRYDDKQDKQAYLCPS
jgi:hypothetical protein